jgi:hypothetical protein
MLPRHSFSFLLKQRLQDDSFTVNFIFCSMDADIDLSIYGSRKLRSPGVLALKCFHVSDPHKQRHVHGLKRMLK